MIDSTHAEMIISREILVGIVRCFDHGCEEQAQAADSDAAAAQPFTGSMPRNGARRGYGRPLFK
jgi:hypothetical protein